MWSWRRLRVESWTPKTHTCLLSVFTHADLLKSIGRNDALQALNLYRVTRGHQVVVVNNLDEAATEVSKLPNQDLEVIGNKKLMTKALGLLIVSEENLMAGTRTV